MSDTATDLATMPRMGRHGEDERLAHLVLKAEWPIALCGAMVRERLGIGAPGRDRCRECLRVAERRGLGRPGWA